MVRRRFFSAVSNHVAPHPSRRASRSSGRGITTSVQLLDRDGYALADADAHGGERALAAALFHAVHRRHGKTRAAHAERMAERNRPAMRVDEIGIVLDAELPQAGYPLRGKGLIELDQIEVADLEAKPLHQFAGRRHRADAHDAR